MITGPENFKCSHCLEESNELEGVFETRDGLICRKCYEKYYTICEDCGEIVPKNEMYGVCIDGETKLICPSCYCRNYFECERCGEAHYISDRREVNTDGGTEDWCFECVEEDTEICADCSEYVASEDARSFGGRPYCPTCYSDNFVDCDGCGRTIRREEAEEYDDDYYCSECYNRINDENENGINDYGYKPSPIFHKTSSDTKAINLYFGIELEIGTGGYSNTNASQINKIAVPETIYIKHDGSISEGFEIVTHPCTMNYHLHEFHWDNICKEALRLGYRSHLNTTCGLHMHVNRSFLGNTSEQRDMTIGNIILFFENNWQDIVIFSRRNGNQLNSWARRTSDTLDMEDNQSIEQEKIKKEKALKLCKASTYSRNRYRAVNLCNRDTVEFRFFRGTLKVNTIFASIQFLQILIETAKKVSSDSMNRWNFAILKREAQRRGYKELLQYLDERNMYKSIKNDKNYTEKEELVKLEEEM